jgi:hypothetical protein
MRTLQSARAPDGHPASYEVRTQFDQESGRYITLVRTWCIECGEAYDLRWDTGGNHPDFIAKKFKQIGWQFDAYKPRKCVCAICLGARHNRSLSEELMPKSNSTAYTPPTTDTAMVTVTNQAADLARRDMTAAQKHRVRTILDMQFDDEKGRYLEGYDDKRVGEEAGVPWAVVVEIRELAYGPLKDDPVIVQYKADVTSLRQEFTALTQRVEKMAIDLKDAVNSFNGRLVNVEAKAKKL